MNYDRACNFFYNKSNMFIDVIIQILHIQIFIKISQLNGLEIKLELLVFSPVPSVMQKVQKLESVNMQGDCKITYKRKTDSSSVFTCSRKVQGGEH